MTPTPQAFKKPAITLGAVTAVFILLILGMITAVSLFYVTVVKPGFDRMAQTEELATLTSQADNLIHAQKYQEALSIIDQALQKTSTNEEKSLVQYYRGVSLYNLKRPEEAKEAFLSSLQFEGGHADVHVYLSGIYMDEKKWDEALSESNKAIAADSGNAVAFYQRGVALSWLGKRDEAIIALEKAVQLDPTNKTFTEDLKNIQGE